MTFPSRLRHLLFNLSLGLTLSACGGGGSSSDRTPTPPIAPVTPSLLAASDAFPSANALTADPDLKTLSITQRGYNDFTFTYAGSCNAQKVVRRSLSQLSENAPSELLDHKFNCTGLASNAMQDINITAQRSNGDEFTTDLNFSTGLANTTPLTVLDSVLSTRDAINDAFRSYLASALLPELNLPTVIELLIATNLGELFDQWVNLNQPNAIYGVTSQRVSYASLDPEGNASMLLTGLIAFPDTSGVFTARDRVVVLAHSTSSTPGDLEATNAWFLTANLLAAQGYLVVAADNWGRGDTSAEPETYLLANRTAANSLDLVRAVLADDQYAAFINTSGPTNLAIVGYSQGGHSAIGLWQTIATQGPDNIAVAQVYAGGGPHNLYATFAGVVEHLNESCNGGLYCLNVDTDTTVPFATNRILPGFLTYTDAGITTADAIDADNLATTFVDNFINNDASVDKLKILLQLNSFTNVSNADVAYSDSNAQLVLFHSAYDRLVPEANTAELAALLGPTQNLDYRSGLCSSSDYATIFNLTTFVGINHTLCGLAMIDEVIGELR